MSVVDLTSWLDAVRDDPRRWADVPEDLMDDLLVLLEAPLPVGVRFDHCTGSGLSGYCTGRTRRGRRCRVDIGWFDPPLHRKIVCWMHEEQATCVWRGGYFVGPEAEERSGVMAQDDDRGHQPHWPDDFKTGAEVEVLNCPDCNAKGQRGSMRMSDDELAWSCPECGATRPTVKGLIIDSKTIVAENGFKPDRERRAG